MAATKIAWADSVWNPVTGCTPVSEGCKNCYARRMAQRLRGRFGYPEDEPFRPGTVHEDRLWEPVGWKPQRIFVCSMGDLFHEAVPFEAISTVWAQMVLCRNHTFMVLTKRPERMTRVVPGLTKDNGPPGNVWLGVSVENQAAANERIPILLSIQAAKRFVSLEPLLGSVNLSQWMRPVPGCMYIDPEDGTCCRNYMTPECHAFVNCPVTRKYGGLHWVIVGGETGPGARPMHPDWVRSVRDQCVAAGVPFWFKGWGDWVPARAEGWWSTGRPILGAKIQNGTKARRYDWSEYLRSYRVGKRSSGALLDGRRWEQAPRLDRR